MLPLIPPPAEKFLSCSQAFKLTGNSARRRLVGNYLHPTFPPQLQQHRFENTFPHCIKERDYYFRVFRPWNVDSWFQMLTCLGKGCVYFFSLFLEDSVPGWLHSSQKVHSARSCLSTSTHPRGAKIQSERRAWDRNTPFWGTALWPPSKQAPPPNSTFRWWTH